MLGLVAERILAVEEDIVTLLINCSAAGAGSEGRGGAGGRVSRGNDTTGVSSGSNLLNKKNKGEENRDAGGVAPPPASTAAMTAMACVGLNLPLVRWTAHFSGWITQGVAFVVIIAHFINSQRTCEFADAPGGRADNVAPDFVYAIVFAELVLFAGFGVTQLAQFTAFDNWRLGTEPHGGGGGGAGRQSFVGRRVEAAYIIQSLVSKTLLGWLVYGGNFA